MRNYLLAKSIVAWFAIHLALSLLTPQHSTQAAAANGEAKENSSARSEKKGPRRFLVSIGISSFSDPLWNRLQYAAKDAHDVFQTLSGRFEGGWLLTTDSEADKKVTADKIRQIFKRLEKANLHPEDTVLIYISSHGTIGKRLNARTQSYSLDKYLVTFETQSELPLETSLSHEELFEQFSKLPSRRKALILDTCYSGTGKSRLSPRMMALLERQKSRFFAEPDDNIIEGSVILSASAWGEEAQESAAHKNGLYTHHLIKGFDEDLNGDGKVTITEAHTYATSQVVTESEGLQHPSAKMELVGGDPIVVGGFDKKQTALRNPILYAFEWSSRKLEIMVNGKKSGNLLKGGIELPPGKIRLALVDPQQNSSILDRVVTLRSGQEYSAEELLRPSKPHQGTVGATFLGFSQGALQQGFAPHPFPGFLMRYSAEGLFSTSDLHVGLFLFPSHKNQVKSLNQAVEHSASLAMADLMLGSHDEVRLLTNRKREIQTFTKWGAGPTLLAIDRQFENQEFRMQKQRATLGGGKFFLGLETRFSEQHLSVGISAEGSVLKSSFDFGPAWIVVGGASLNAGMMW
jgi:hypothetical protein